MEPKKHGFGSDDFWDVQVNHVNFQKVVLLINCIFTLKLLGKMKLFIITILSTIIRHVLKWVAQPPTRKDSFFFLVARRMRLQMPRMWMPHVLGTGHLVERGGRGWY